MNIIEKLKELEAGMGKAPWCEGRLEEGIRHIDRNCNIGCYVHPEGCPSEPGRYDGNALASLRNALPALLMIAEGASKISVTYQDRFYGKQCPDCNGGNGLDGDDEFKYHDEGCPALLIEKGLKDLKEAGE